MQMGKWMTAMGAVLLFGLTGCARYEPAGAFEEPVTLTETESETSAGLERNAAEESTEEGAAALTEKEPEPIAISTISRPEPVKVRGIYVSAYVAGTGNRMDEILNQMEGTGLNAVVIDLKDDEGRITCEMDSPLVNEIGASRVLIQDMPGLIESLKERGIYPIARVVAFRDPYLAEQKPEWSLHMTDGSIYRDGNGLAWVNPYRQEVWDYLVEVGKKAGELGFAEVQFDYVRFSVDSGVEGVAFDPEDTGGRSKTEAISQFMDYAYGQLSREGLYVSADVFGTIIRSGQDAQAVGQDYREMAGQGGLSLSHDLSLPLRRTAASGLSIRIPSPTIRFIRPFWAPGRPWKARGWDENQGMKYRGGGRPPGGGAPLAPGFYRLLSGPLYRLRGRGSPCSDSGGLRRRI